MAIKKSVKPSARNASVQLVEVTLRRSNGGGGVPKGRYILIINKKVFGSTGDNWLGGAKATFESKEAALAAAAKMGGRVAV